MKLLHNLLGIIFAICLMVVLLITSVEAVTYWTPGYYEKEYAKYDVAKAVDMTMDDLLKVTKEMMAYLRGNRPDLHVWTIRGGQPMEFFNAKEIAHMEDVRGLFLAALSLRRFCLMAMALCLALLLLSRAKLRAVLPRTTCIGTGLFFAAAAALAALVSTDFNKYFILFHHIFFHNNLWLLDPRTDMLINIVPEPFFSDTALRIGLTFGALAAVVFVASLALAWRYSARNSTKKR